MLYRTSPNVDGRKRQGSRCAESPGVWRQAGRVSASEIMRMSELIAHRGPDDSGSVLIRTRNGSSPARCEGQAETDENADLALASRRLAILDLSSAGHQPSYAAPARRRSAGF
jgi:asparagine synthetase B (glutamine-hydrolysing)